MGIGISDCKKALEACNGDYQESIKWLRTKGIATAAKKSGRIAAEGLVGVSVAGNTGFILEINSETDFVANNEKFQQLFTDILPLKTDLPSLLECKTHKGDLVGDLIIAATASIGEKISIRRSKTVSVKNGAVVSYVHNAVANNSDLGKIGVMVSLESDSSKIDDLKKFAKQLCMHVVANAPKYLDRSSVDASDLENEKQILKAQAKASGKSDDVIEKMVEGRISKFYSDVVLLEQLYVMDNKKKVSDVVSDFAKDIGGSVKIADFVYFKVGDGIQKQESDFASEVAAAAGTGK
jgi:elongation factor Ts